MPEAAVIIPARFASTRFPGKPLALLGGKPIIIHAVEGASTSRLARRVIVATDDSRIYDAVTSAGFDAVMTANTHESGTDRVAEAAGQIPPYDIIVNVQGDEPFIRGELIDELIGILRINDSADIATPAVAIRDVNDLLDPNVVKVAMTENRQALYFSRAPIPYHRDLWSGKEFSLSAGAVCYRHVGIYAYRREALMAISRAPVSSLERIEKLEQLRALSLGYRIMVAETSESSIGVDTPDDLLKAEKWLNSYS
ncbi:MAG: 3-deoxy-manno-octulosonate cytidylyltransferase [Nitrospirae bacterium]|nr:3-deoxy-manno-octulosonate cytidylyltransferase [Nitrospirota bacterium]